VVELSIAALAAMAAVSTGIFGMQLLATRKYNLCMLSTGMVFNLISLGMQRKFSRGGQ